MKIKPLIFAALCCTPFAANAAEEKAEPIAPHTCTKPEKADGMQVSAYKTAVDEYQKCIAAYVKEHSDTATKYQDLAKANSDAANAAMNDWNTFVTNEMAGNQQDAKPSDEVDPNNTNRY